MQAPYTSKQQPPRADVESSAGGLVIGQLNSLRARAEAGEAEGGDTAATFNFKCLLRQSAVLPTGEPGHVTTRDNTSQHVMTHDNTRCAESLRRRRHARPGLEERWRCGPVETLANLAPVNL